MSINAKFPATAALIVALALLEACNRPRATHLTVSELMDDRVTRDSILMKCNRSQSISDSDIDCLNARVAIERIAIEKERENSAAHTAQFERRRDQLRLAEDAQRQAQEAAEKVDPYSLPVAPVPETAAPAAAPAAQNP